MANNCDEHEEVIVQQDNTESILHLSKDRIIFLNEDFSDYMANSFAALLIAYSNIDPNKEIIILINSSGGSVTAFTLMNDIINLIKTPIKTVCISKAYSAGALLLSSGTKGRRYALSNSLIMIHGLQCVFPVGGYDIKSSDQYLDFLDNYNNIIIDILSKNTGKTIEEIKNDCKQDYFLTPEDAKAYGIIDEIVDDFNQIIPISSSEINSEEQIEEDDDSSGCDFDCVKCSKNKSCEYLNKINDYLTTLRGVPHFESDDDE